MKAIRYSNHIFCEGMNEHLMTLDLSFSLYFFLFNSTDSAEDICLESHDSRKSFSQDGARIDSQLRRIVMLIQVGDNCQFDTHLNVRILK